MFVLMTVNVLCIKHAYRYSVVQTIVTELLHTAKRSLRRVGLKVTPCCALTLVACVTI